MSEKFEALRSKYDEKWGVVDSRGGILYEGNIDTQEEAEFIADFHNQYPDAEYERDVLPAWEAHRALAPAAAPAADGGEDDSGYSELIDELNGRIKALERERDALASELATVRAALKPFANLAESAILELPQFDGDSSTAFICGNVSVTIGQCRELAALAASGRAESGEGE